jgi:hypothetical protein
VRAIEIDESKTVFELKLAIVAESPATIKCKPGYLKLFLAKKDNARVSDDDTALETLEEGTIDDVFPREQVLANRMKPTSAIAMALKCHEMLGCTAGTDQV